MVSGTEVQQPCTTFSITRWTKTNTTKVTWVWRGGTVGNRWCKRKMRLCISYRYGAKTLVFASCVMMFLSLEIIPPIRIFVQLKEIFTCMLLIATMGAFQAFNQRTRFLLPIVYVRRGVGRPTSKSFGGKNNTRNSLAGSDHNSLANCFTTDVSICLLYDRE